MLAVGTVEDATVLDLTVVDLLEMLQTLDRDGRHFDLEIGNLEMGSGGKSDDLVAEYDQDLTACQTAGGR